MMGTAKPPIPNCGKISGQNHFALRSVSGGSALKINGYTSSGSNQSFTSSNSDTQIYLARNKCLSVTHLPMKVIEHSDNEDAVRDKNSSKKFQQSQNRMEWVGLYQGSHILSRKPHKAEENLSPISPLMQNSPNTKTAMFQQFWKAGDYDVQVTKRKSLPDSFLFFSI